MPSENAEVRDCLLSRDKEMSINIGAYEHSINTGTQTVSDSQYLTYSVVFLLHQWCHSDYISHVCCDICSTLLKYSILHIFTKSLKARGCVVQMQRVFFLNVLLNQSVVILLTVQSVSVCVW